MTPKRRYRVVENDEYAAFVRRRSSAPTATVSPPATSRPSPPWRPSPINLEDATRQAINELNAFGYSWADIGMRLGITRQGAQQRWGDTPTPVTDTSASLRDPARDPIRLDAGSRARNP